MHHISLRVGRPDAVFTCFEEALVGGLHFPNVDLSDRGRVAVGVKPQSLGRLVIHMRANSSLPAVSEYLDQVFVDEDA